MELNINYCLIIANNARKIQENFLLIINKLFYKRLNLCLKFLYSGIVLATNNQKLGP